MKDKKKRSTKAFRNHYAHTYIDTGLSTRDREQLSRGCYRRTVDSSYDDCPETWAEAVYLDHRPVHLRKAKQRVDRWLQHGY